MFALDHIVIAAKDPKKAAEAFCQRKGVTAIPGGKHEDWGTYNYLAYFNNDCYIEWLGIYDEIKAKAAKNPLIPQLLKTFQTYGEVPYQIALRTTDIKSHVEYFTEAEIPFVGPLDGSRRKPNGDLLEWSMLFPESEKPIFHPFIMEWGKKINLPDDKKQINRSIISTISLATELVEPLKSMYQLEVTSNQIQLANCQLTLDSTANQVALQLENHK